MRPGATYAVFAAILLSACTTTEDANNAMKSRFIGQSSDVFFSQYGMPLSSFPLNDGGTLYRWRGGQTTQTIPAEYRTIELNGKQQQQLVTPARTEALYCEAQISTNARGIITNVQTTNDTTGAGFSLSRCAEVFGVQK